MCPFKKSIYKRFLHTHTHKHMFWLSTSWKSPVEPINISELPLAMTPLQREGELAARAHRPLPDSHPEGLPIASWRTSATSYLPPTPWRRPQAPLFPPSLRTGALLSLPGQDSDGHCCLQLACNILPEAPNTQQACGLSCRAKGGFQWFINWINASEGLPH